MVSFIEKSLFNYSENGVPQKEAPSMHAFLYFLKITALESFV